MALAPEHDGADGTKRKDHYGAGKQPWDTIKELGWGPEFAAANVIKYLRRSKDPEHSLESARWYYAQLRDMADASDDPHPQRVRIALHKELTPDEVNMLYYNR